MKRASSVLAVVFLLAHGSAFAHGGSHKKVAGKITKVESGMLHISGKGGKETLVHLTPDTRYMVGKAPGSVSDAQPGLRIVVHLTPDGSKAEEVHLPASKVPNK